MPHRHAHRTPPRHAHRTSTRISAPRHKHARRQSIIEHKAPRHKGPASLVAARKAPLLVHPLPLCRVEHRPQGAGIAGRRPQGARR